MVERYPEVDPLHIAGVAGNIPPYIVVDRMGRVVPPWADTGQRAGQERIRQNGCRLQDTICSGAR